MQGIEQDIPLPTEANAGMHSREVAQPGGTMEVDQPDTTQMQQPARHLEDEQSHVHRGGSLRLTDFEVKGTLGALHDQRTRSPRPKKAFSS